MEKCLILGANGFIGKALCNELEKEYFIRAFDKSEKIEIKTNNQMEYKSGDFTLIEDFDELLQDVDIVIHLISTTIPSESTSNIEIEIMQNIVPTVRLLESMVRCNVKKIIFASSAGTIYGETTGSSMTENDYLSPICSYGVQKKVVENYLELYGNIYNIKYEILRMSNPYGIGQNLQRPQGIIPIFINQLLKDNKITVFGDGNNKRDYIFMSDVVNAFKAALKYNGNEKVFNIGYGQSYTINEIIRTIEELTCKRFKNIEYIEKRKCDVIKNEIDVSKSKNILNWKAEVDLKIGIEIIYKKYKEIYDNKK